METTLEQRKIEWIGDETHALTSYYFFQEFEWQGFCIEIWVSFSRWLRHNGTVDFEQRYKYKIYQGAEEITDQRGITLVHPEQAVNSAKRWLIMYGYVRSA